MKQFRKVLALTLALVLSLSLAACASKSAAENVEKVPAEEAASDTVEQKGTITVAASPTPHAEILEQAKPILQAMGWTLEVKEFQDYVQPNNVVESGEFDANYFQHIPYLENFNEEQGTHLVNAGGIHYEPFGIYPGTKSSLDDIAEGDTIAVPNDTTNEARALLLLQDNGILKLKDGAGLTATVLDIEENPYNVEILELEAAQVPRVKDEVAYVVLNGNYALDAGFSVAKDSLAYEKSDSDAAKTYVNVIAVKEGNENSEKIQALVAALKSDIKLRDANTYTDQKILDMYQYLDGRLRGVEGQISAQAVVNAQITANLSCMQNTLNTLSGLTKTVIPIGNVCPEPMPAKNSWTAPTAAAAG